MNKAELITAISESVDLPKTTATAVVDAFTFAITSALQKGDNVTLVGFGTFDVKHRAAREGRNPQTGAAIKIAAVKVPSFKPGKNLKDALRFCTKSRLTSSCEVKTVLKRHPKHQESGVS